jgi:hypothetical protein
MLSTRCLINRERNNPNKPSAFPLEQLPTQERHSGADYLAQLELRDVIERMARDLWNHFGAEDPKTPAHALAR